MESEEYPQLLENIKARVRQARLLTAVAVNKELTLLYWGIGRQILLRHGQLGWGDKVAARLGLDLRQEFPDIYGFSPRNFNYMLAFARAWHGKTILPELLSKLSWYHNIALMDRLDNAVRREWYARQTVKNGWGRNFLIHQIETDLCGRCGGAGSISHVGFPPVKSDLANELIRDPYPLEFLGLIVDQTR